MATNNTHPLNIYRQYQSSRNADAISVPGDWRGGRKISESTLPASIADELYRQYQATRKGSALTGDVTGDVHESMTDEIMSFIGAQEAVREQQLKTIRSIPSAGGSEQSTSARKSRSARHTLFSRHRRSAGTGRSFREQLISTLPLAAVVAMVAVLLAWVGGDREVESVTPPVLAYHAADSTSFIDQRDALTLGFSTAHSLHKRAFGRGVLSTNIGLVALSGNTEAASQFERKLDQLLEQDVAKRVVEQLNALVMSVNSSSDINAATVVENEQVMSALDDLRVTIGGKSNYPESTWFDIGLSLQSVYLSARLDRDLNRESVLKDSLQRFAGLSIPEGLPASRPLNKLRALAESPDTADVNEVLSLCETIKVLMS